MKGMRVTAAELPAGFGAARLLEPQPEHSASSRGLPDKRHGRG